MPKGKPHDLYIPHIGVYDGGTHADDKRYIVRIRVPAETRGAPSLYVALSDFTTEKDIAETWLTEQRKIAGRMLADQARYARRFLTLGHFGSGLPK